MQAHVGCIATPTSQWPSTETSPNQFLLSITGLGRFRVRHGREVTVEPADGVDEETIRPYFLGTCLGVVLHQRGVLALHASGVRTSHGAILALGHSGAGKSTLISALVRSGCQLIADDVCAVVPDEHGWPQVLPGLRHLKLSREAIEQMGVNRENVRRLRHPLEKLSVSVSESAVRAPTPLRAMYLLEPSAGTEPRFETLTGPERVWTLSALTYRSWYLDGLGRRADNFKQVSMAARAPLTRVERPTDLRRIDQLASAVLRHAETLGE